MKRIQKLTALLLCTILLLENVFAITVLGDGLGELYLENRLTHVFSPYPLSPYYAEHWRKGKTIPIDYNLYIFQGSYTFHVESSLDIAHTLDESRVYSAGDTRLSFKIDLLELPKKQTVDFDIKYREGNTLFFVPDFPECDYIYIIGQRVGDNKTIIHMNIYLLHCQYGLFLCEHDGEGMYRSVGEWKASHKYDIVFYPVLALIAGVFIICSIVWVVNKIDTKRRIAALQKTEHIEQSQNTKSCSSQQHYQQEKH